MHDLSHANRVLGLAKQWAKDHKQKLIFRPLEESSVFSVDVIHVSRNIRDVARKSRQHQVLLAAKAAAKADAPSLGVAAVHDASFMQQPREGSQSGYAIMLGSISLYDGNAVTHLIDWGCQKVHRKVRSTLAAEAVGAAVAYDRAMFARAMLAEIEHGLDGHWKEACKDIPFCLGTDCKSLYDLCKTEGSMPQERRVALDIMDVREGIEELGDHIRWVPTDHMLVDCMTKAMQPDAMLEFLATGRYAFKYDEQITETKRSVAKARKAAKEAKKQANSDPNKPQLKPKVKPKAKPTTLNPAPAPVVDPSISTEEKQSKEEKLYDDLLNNRVPSVADRKHHVAEYFRK